MSHHPDDAQGQDVDASTESKRDHGPEKPAEDSPHQPDPPSPGPYEVPSFDAHTETASDRSEERLERSRVTNVFYGMVNAQNGVFGTADTEERTPNGGRTSVTGPLRGHEVQAVTDTFAAPERFGEAFEFLEEQQVLVLAGGPGSGKRTGAIRLLSLVECDKITVLSPSQTLDSLSGHELRPGRGYIVLDWFGADRRSSPAERQYLWSILIRHVQDSRAHLILTCDPGSFLGSAAPVFTWTRPSVGEVVRRHLDQECERLGTGSPDDFAEAVETVVNLLPGDGPVADLVAVAQGMAKGDPPGEAVERVLRSSSHDRVEEWFESGPDSLEIAEATALSLLPDIRERDYEILAHRLNARLKRAFSHEEDEPEKDGVARPDRLPMHRRRRSNAEHHLFRVEYRDDGWMVRRFPCFTEAGDGPEVLRQVWERYDVTFWDAVQDWIGSAIGHRVRRVHLAKGLAALAVFAFDEVHDLYLDRWSRQSDVPGREACVFALWFMCMESAHGLTPTVLRTVDRWLFQGSEHQRETAIQVWSGELGVSYPIEAANRLLGLVLDPEESQRVEAAFAVGALFGSLLDRGAGGRSLVRFVGDEMAHAHRFSPRRKEREPLLLAAFSLLTVPTSESLAPDTAESDDTPQDLPGDADPGRNEQRGSKRTDDHGAGHGDPPNPEAMGARNDEETDAEPAVARHIMLAPDQISEVAALWAETIRDRRTRRPAIDSLLAALRALQRNGNDAQRNARNLLVELSRRIPEEEYPGFLASVASIARRREDTDSFTDAVLDVLSGIFGADGASAGTQDAFVSPLTEKVTTT